MKKFLLQKYSQTILHSFQIKYAWEECLKKSFFKQPYCSKSTKTSTYCMSLCPMLKETLENSYTILQILQILYVSANRCKDGNWRNILCVYICMILVKSMRFYFLTENILWNCMKDKLINSTILVLKWFG